MEERVVPFSATLAGATSPSVIIPGEVVQLTLTATGVTSGGVNYVPTGTCSLTASTGAPGGGAYTLGTATLVPAGGGSLNATASIPTNALMNSGYGNLTLSYSGDGNFSPGTALTAIATATPDGPPLLADIPAVAGVGPVQSAGGTTAPAPSIVSAANVNYGTGTTQVVRSDLSSGGAGLTYGQTWTWSNAAGYSDALSGSGATQAQAPHLVQQNLDDCIAMVSDGQTARFFDRYGGAYHPRFYDAATLTHNTTAGTFTATDGAGNTYTFYDFSSSTPTGRAGKMQQMTDRYGNLTSVTSWATGGQPGEVQQTVGAGATAVTDSFAYTYVSAGVNAGLVATVTQRAKVGAGAWTTIRAVAYAYYDGTTGPGTAGALKTAAVQDATATVIDTTYYRYYTSGTGSTGNMKYVFGPAAYARLTAALGTGVDTLTDAQVSPYADTALAYDSSGRVTTATEAGAGSSATAGGLGTYTYAYTSNAGSGPLLLPNVWRAKTVETLPDGNTNTVYMNGFGQVMLTVYTDTTTAQSWDTYTRYNTNGQAVLTAAPAAVTGYSASLSDLIGYTGPGATYLSSSSGLIVTYAYATTTTATTGTAGDAAGYVKESDLQQGTGGTAVKQQTQTYLASPVGTFVPASATAYRNTDGTGGETTSASYTWQGSTAQPASITTTRPAVTTGENGPGTATSTTTVFDQYGRPIWTKDAGGFLSYTQYDPGTGAVVKQITDVNTANTSDFTGLPSGWTTPTGGGLELITTAQVDGLGRPTRVTDPAGKVTYTVYLDAAHKILTYPGWNSSTTAPTGPTRVIREDRANNYIETFTMTAAPHLTGGVPDGTEAIAGLQSLSRSYRNAAGQTTAVDAYVNLGGLAYATGVMGTAGANFYQTQYAYDAGGRQNKVVSPQGTITRTVYDGQGRTVSSWIGTNDTPASGTWSPTNNTSPSNMVDVRDYQYDGGGVGDGTLTKVTEHPGGGAADRVTQTWYDWRDRAVATKQGVSSTETDGANRPLTVTTYDNLGEVTQTQQYAADGVTPSIVGGVLSLPTGTSAGLRAQTVTSYDELGRKYQTQVYDVNPSTGTVSTSALTTNDYYDARGNLIAESAPGGVWTKTSYDGAGRVVYSYTTDGAGGTSYSAASSVSGDDVLTQTQTLYDADSNPIETIRSDRFDTATGTGSLGTPTTGVSARVSYTASYYDAANRLVASVAVGTNGGSSWTRPSSVPTGSGTVLVTTESYAADAVQAVRLTGSPTGGTFTLSFGGQTTSAIAYNATAATVQTAVQALSSIGSGNAVVTAAAGGGWQVRFAGTLAGAFQAALTASGSGLTGGTSPSAAVSVVSAGGDAGRVQAVTDPLGLVSRTYFDALGRTVMTVKNYTGAAETTGADVATEYTYDGAGHTLSVQADEPNGAYQKTAYVYGVTTSGGSGVNSNDLLAATQHPDPTTGAPSSSQQDTQTVNALGQVLTATDRNGTVHTYTYDVLGRKTADAVTTLGTGVDGAVREITTAYDGQGNPYLVTSYASATGGTVVNQVENLYDGLGQLITQYQAVGGAVNTSSTPKVQYAYSEMAGGANHSRLTSVTYPDGYVVNSSYGTGLDTAISRLTSLSDSATTLESYKYLGLGTVVERDHPQPGVNQTFISPTSSTGDAGDKYVGLDRFGRVVDQNWYNPSTSSSVEEIQYGYDADGNVLWRNDTVNTAFGEVYTYDGLNQLATFARGTLNGTKTGITGTASATQSWSNDALGNWTSVTTNGTAQSRTANQQNEYTAVGPVTPTYDADGNLTTDETGRIFVYDAWGRMVAVRVSPGTTIETDAYDGLGRRVSTTASSTTTTFYYSTDWQVVEETSSGYYTTRYVWSPVYVNAMVTRDTDTSGTGLTATGTGYQRLYAVEDANWDVTALVNTSGVAVERDAYSPFGTVIVMNASWSTISGSAYSWVYGFQGMRYDAVSGLDKADYRWYSPTLGRWTQTDPKGFAAGDVNLERFVGNEPVNRLDPSGLQPPPWRPGPPIRGLPPWQPGPPIQGLPVWQPGPPIQGLPPRLVTLGTPVANPSNSIIITPFSPGQMMPWIPPGTTPLGIGGPAPRTLLQRLTGTKNLEGNELTATPFVAPAPGGGPLVPLTFPPPPSGGLPVPVQYFLGPYMYLYSGST